MRIDNFEFKIIQVSLFLKLRNIIFAISFNDAMKSRNIAFENLNNI